MIKYRDAFDQNVIFRKHKRKLRELRSGPKESQSQLLRIAILSGVTIEPVNTLIQFLLEETGFNTEVFLGDYNSFDYESKFSMDLVNFDPDLVYIHTNIDNVVKFPDIADGQLSAEECVKKYLEHITGCIESLLDRTRAMVIMNNLEQPSIRINGNYEGVNPSGNVRFVNSVNDKLADYAHVNNRVLLNDINYLSSKVGLENWRDEKNYLAFKQPFTSRACVELSRSVSSLILASYGKSKKAIVFDLDNTLWGGIIGDDGAENIKIGTENPQSESHLRFQRALRPLLDRGIAFAICSKNELEIAKSGFDRIEMVFSYDDFHVHKINWEAKSKNLRDICSALNIGSDSVVFIDDSEFERNEVNHGLPDIYIPDNADEPISFLQAISDEYVFETTSIVEADRRRNESFKLNINLNVSTDPGDVKQYLKSLQLRADFDHLNEQNLERVHQLINKTNQFNLTTQRMNIADLRRTHETGVVLTASLKDKNMNYGLVSVLWGSQDSTDCFLLQNWVMSCRVFNRNLEYVFFDNLIEKLNQSGITKIKSNYIASAKNRPVEDLHSKLGFKLLYSDEEKHEYEIEIDTRNLLVEEKYKDIYA